jgi:hypothetical protein
VVPLPAWLKAAFRCDGLLYPIGIYEVIILRVGKYLRDGAVIKRSHFNQLSYMPARYMTFILSRYQAVIILSALTKAALGAVFPVGYKMFAVLAGLHMFPLLVVLKRTDKS